MKYNQDEVIEKATILFWQRGFQGAGMRDIQQALDMRPGSIYARFQSKEGLFKLVIDKYAENSELRLNQVATASSPVAALRDFFAEALLHPNKLRFMRQCLLIKSVNELDTIGDIAKKAVVEGMQTLQNCFKNIVVNAVEQGELPNNTPVELAANWLQNQFVGLRAFALMQNDQTQIYTMIDKVISDLKQPWPSALH